MDAISFTRIIFHVVTAIGPSFTEANQDFKAAIDLISLVGVIILFDTPYDDQTVVA